jgi:hypothetical protein
MFYGNYDFEIRINEKKILMQMKPCDRRYMEVRFGDGIAKMSFSPQKTNSVGLNRLSLSEKAGHVFGR